LLDTIARELLAFPVSECSTFTPVVRVSLRNPAGEPIPDGRKPVRMAGIKTTSHRSKLGVCLKINNRMSCTQSGFASELSLQAWALLWVAPAISPGLASEDDILK
jgi:hypothetical protein